MTSYKLYFLAAIFLAYGYLCRFLDIYFFWDSKSIGYVILFLGGIRHLVENIQIRRLQNRKAILQKIGIAVFTFMIVVGAVFSISVRLFSDAYETATRHIKNDASLKEEMGDIVGFSMVTTGTIRTKTTSHGDYGYAIFHLTIRGQKKFKDVEIRVIKDPIIPGWKVKSVE